MTNVSVGLNLLVVIWLLITGLGCIQSYQLLSRARAAKLWLVDRKLNGIRLHAADAAIRLADARIFVQVCLFTMGVVALSLQYYPLDSNGRNILSSIFRMLMIAVAATLTFKSRMEIHELDRILAETEKLRVHEANAAAALEVSVAQVISTDKNTAELEINNEELRRNTNQRQMDGENA